MTARSLSYPGAAKASLILLTVMCGCQGTTPPPTTTAPREAADSVLYSWIELGPQGAISARAITGEDSCPSITIGKTTVPMHRRADSAPASFEVTSCEHTVAAGASSVSIAVQSSTNSRSDSSAGKSTHKN